MVAKDDKRIVKEVVGESRDSMPENKQHGDGPKSARNITKEINTVYERVESQKERG